ncbi:isochorismatase domain-containing 2-like protein [Piptocephalis cylindrospora]|uniref:Isochorismatase domain-containing 2-like protein n=1 Tax=Piptocephalis cylindrospora TaxID=1907219 RepID=A0A4P9Y2E7_9FUNG|nr:isochorismatase domain-containing 2-like protein [Piptocephalis cylindrospora]|eukprot:RKP12995.1 isochorismatase domain-containing 2-like protein [Piptocephalis cylindrospora]
MTLPQALYRLYPKNTAFFVCDIQERFTSLIYGFDGVVSTSQKMLKASKILNVPVVVTEQKPSALGKTVKELDVAHAVIRQEKQKFSMLIPEVRQWLEKEKIRSVVIFGIEAHVCVLQTALDLLTLPNLTQGSEAGGVHVLADAVSSTNAPEIPVAIERMRNAGACITSSESVLFQILHDADHPQFRQVSSLIKEYRSANESNPLWPSKI